MLIASALSLTVRQSCSNSARLAERRSQKAPVECPIFVGLDKHTVAGREALKRAAKKAKVPYTTAALISFYLEGAKANEMIPAPWWIQEVTWKLLHANPDIPRAEEMWHRIRPIVIKELKTKTSMLEFHLEVSIPTEPSNQLTLL